MRPYMSIGTRLEVRLTPQLILMMRLVTLPSLELRQEVLKALEENPGLEEDSSDEDAEEPVPDDDTRLLEYLEDGAPGLVRSAVEVEPDADDRPRPEPSASTRPDLREHLLEQLHDDLVDPALLEIGEWIIENLDERGFLDKDCVVIALHLGAEVDQVTKVLNRIQRFDPVGSAARDSRECLLVQAQHSFPEYPHLAGLIQDHLPALKERRYPAIARALGISVAEVVEEEARLLTLNPVPSRGFGLEDSATITPDVHVIQVGSNFVVRVDDDGLPKLRLSGACRQMLRDRQAASAEDRAYIRARLTAAKWFVRAVYERHRTIHKVTESIVRFQHDFFEHGPQQLRALALRDVADEIGVAESTVSRVTSGKYVSTPRGVFELRYFFGSGFRTASGTGEVSSRSVRESIRLLVAAEDPGRPLSDQQITAHIRRLTGVELARRTVAKYREEMSMGSSCERRQQRLRGPVTGTVLSHVTSLRA